MILGIYAKMEMVRRPARFLGQFNNAESGMPSPHSVHTEAHLDLSFEACNAVLLDRSTLIGQNLFITFRQQV